MTALGDLLKRRIAREGPVSVAEYMALALGHPEHGYYMTRDPLGRAGDFVTAPEISQMFGELIGLWAAQVWLDMGRPAPFKWIELGPGRGTLAADAFRAMKGVPGLEAALEVHLLETSPVLRAHQERAVAGGAQWHDDLGRVPSGPGVMVANEFFDALPIHQYVRDGAGWRERMVTMGEGGGFAFTLSAPLAIDPLLPESFSAAADGAIAEASPASVNLVRAVVDRITASGGAALFVDYGYDASAPGDTLQAVRGHAYADPLADPGEADLTAHVDFAALGRAARGAGAAVHGPIGQGDFLARLGIELRAETLKRDADAAARAAVDAALARLTGADAMGRLFRVLALSAPGGAVPAGFE